MNIIERENQNMSYVNPEAVKFGRFSLKGIKESLGITQYCTQCGGETVFDEERFNLGYSVRRICLKRKGKSYER